MAQNDKKASLGAVASVVTRGAFSSSRYSQANQVDASRLGRQGVSGLDAHARRADLAVARGTYLLGVCHAVPNHVANAQALVVEAGGNRGAQSSHCDGGSCPVASVQAAAPIRAKRAGELDCGLAANVRPEVEEVDGSRDVLSSPHCGGHAAVGGGHAATAPAVEAGVLEATDPYEVAELDVFH
jgi:hypothetical protein